MKKLLLPIVGFVTLFIGLFSFKNPHKLTTNKPLVAAAVKRDTTAIVNNVLVKHNRSATTTLYQNLQLEKAGLSFAAFQYAVHGYQTLVAEGKVPNEQYLSIADFSQSSRKKRFFLIDMKNQKLVKNTFVAHGKNSGLDKTTSFFNTLNSEQSSLGFYITKNTYIGKNGFSLRMAGMDQGFNDNAEARAVVVHGAPYVNAARVNAAYMGRSQGCPALPLEEYEEVIEKIKGGSVLFNYFPSENYLQGSTVLNEAA